MTSKNLFFKLMIEDLKRRVWAIAWCVVSMVFALVVPTALRCSESVSSLAAGDPAIWTAEAVRIVEKLHLDVPVVIVLVLTAVLWAVSGFHYLHNRQKVDFYHSIPVKRRELFLAAYLNGILVPLGCYVLAQAAAVGFVLMAGIGMERFGSLPWQSVLINSAYYCLLYTVVVVAMMMTGHVAVALLGTGVFYLYGPTLAALYEWFCTSNFRTWFMPEAAGQGRLIQWILRYTSPLSNYIFALVDFSENQWSCLRAFPVMAVTAALALLAYGLYRLRASEAAGRAMAFPKTRAPIRILLTVPAGVAAGLFFGSIGHSAAWLMFGSVCGALLMHCLTEIIYHFDFKKLFANRYQMVLVTAAVLALNMAGYYDLFGYDAWYPKADEIADATVFDEYADNWLLIGKPEFTTDYSPALEPYFPDSGDPEAGSGCYYLVYDSKEDYRFEHMKLTDAYTVSELARWCAEQEKALRFDPHEGNRDIYRSITMRVKLKSGREVYRQYSYVEKSGESEDLFASILDSREFKTGAYPVMAQTAGETAVVTFGQYIRTAAGSSGENTSGGYASLDLDAEGRAALLAAYQEDMLDLRLDTLKKEVPVGEIQFLTAGIREAMEYNKALQNRSGRYIPDLTQSDWYPVYPSFTRTIAALEAAGVEIRALADEDIRSISIYYQGKEYLKAADTVTVWTQAGSATGDAAAETGKPEQVPAVETWGSGEAEVEYEDEADIRALAPALLCGEFLWMNDYYENPNLATGVSVDLLLGHGGSRQPQSGAYQSGTYRDDSVERINCEIDLSKLTPQTAKKYGLTQ